MNNAFLILSHIFAIANAEPDTHVHLHLPPEAGQGNTKYKTVPEFHLQGSTPNTGGGGIAR